MPFGRPKMRGPFTSSTTCSQGLGINCAVSNILHSFVFQHRLMSSTDHFVFYKKLSITEVVIPDFYLSHSD